METQEQKEWQIYEDGRNEGFDDACRALLKAKIKRLLEELQFNDIEEALDVETKLLTVLKRRKSELV